MRRDHGSAADTARLTTVIGIASPFTGSAAHAASGAPDDDDLPMPTLLRPDDVPEIARRQRGVFTRAQAHAAGYTTRQVSYRIASGAWIPLPARGLVSATSRQMPTAPIIATWVHRPGSIVMGPAAAAWHGAPVPQLERVDIWTDQLGDGIRDRIKPHRVPLAPWEVEHVGTFGGAPALTTHRERAWRDALAWLPFDSALDLSAWLAARDEFDRDGIERALLELPGLVGNRQLRRLLEATVNGAFSVAERKGHDALRAAGITGWHANVQVRDRIGVVGRADIFFDDVQLDVEIDGRAAHEHRSDEDRERDNRMHASGRTVLRFPARVVLYEPDRFVSTVGTTLATLRARR